MQQAVPSCMMAATVSWMPSEVEVLKAVASLYDDGLRPYSRILRKRLVERAQDVQAALHGECGDMTIKDCDAGRLRALCEVSLHLHVEPAHWGEWSAVLLDRETNFVDIYNPIDYYSEEFWTAAEHYFKSLDNSSDLAGGRYASAKALAERRLPFLQGYSLGQICHITQLAISKHKLLGYYNGAVVPYDRSTSMLKCRCAQELRPVADPPAVNNRDGPIQFRVADWDTARLKLREIMDSAAIRGAESVPLSNVKRLFRSLYQMELSETALGYAKLTELLQDPRFNDICIVQLQDRGYAVVRASPIPTTPLNSNHIAYGTDRHQVTPHNGTEEHQALDPSNGMPQQQSPVRAKVPPLNLTPRMIRRSMSMPSEFGLGKETRDKYATSLDGILSHRSGADSKCSTARGPNDESDGGGNDGTRGLTRMASSFSEVGWRSLTRTDSNFSEGSGWVSPTRGAGAELRAVLQRRLSKAKGCI